MGFSDEEPQREASMEVEELSDQPEEYRTAHELLGLFTLLLLYGPELEYAFL